jgi:hypothetical protein
MKKRVIGKRKPDRIRLDMKLKKINLLWTVESAGEEAAAR